MLRRFLAFHSASGSFHHEVVLEVVPTNTNKQTKSSITQITQTHSLLAEELHHRLSSHLISQPSCNPWIHQSIIDHTTLTFHLHIIIIIIIITASHPSNI